MMSLPVVSEAVKRLRSRFSDFAIHEGPAPDRVEGSGTAVVEVLDGGPWAQPPNGARHRVVQVNVLADRSRDTDGLPLADDADRRAWDLWEALDDLLNDPGQDWRDTGWSAVHHSRRSDGPTLTPIPDGDGSVLLSARYEVSHD